MNLFTNIFMNSLNNFAGTQKLLTGEPGLDLKKYARFRDCVEYLSGTENFTQRHLSLETLRKYKVGVGEEAFKMENGEIDRLTVIYYPFFRATSAKSKKRLDKDATLEPERRDPTLALARVESDFEIVKCKSRAIGAELKHFQKFMPVGGNFGVFGLNTITPSDKVIVITEGEFDAMAVNQVTNLPAISLPNGASNLPNQLIPILEKFERVYLWMDNDEAGQINLENFATKLGVNRTYIIRPEPNTNSEHGIKDANDALRRNPEIIKDLIQKAKPIPSENVIQFAGLREQVQNRIFNVQTNSGLKSNYFPWYNKLFKGFRRGELTIFTGPTGSGKTTFLSQLSLDFAAQGLPT
jgi:twinkle protein